MRAFPENYRRLPALPTTEPTAGREIVRIDDLDFLSQPLSSPFSQHPRSSFSIAKRFVVRLAEHTKRDDGGGSIVF